MWQEIAVIGIGIATLLYVGWKVYTFFTIQKHSSNPHCGGCTGCSMHNERGKHGSRRC